MEKMCKRDTLDYIVFLERQCVQREDELQRSFRKCKNPVTTHRAANMFTGGDSVITGYYPDAKRKAKCKCRRNHSAKYKTMMHCLLQTDKQHKDK